MTHMTGRGEKKEEEKKKTEKTDAIINDIPGLERVQSKPSIKTFKS